jgi:hypothetical protein
LMLRGIQRRRGAVARRRRIANSRIARLASSVVRWRSVFTRVVTARTDREHTPERQDQRQVGFRSHKPEQPSTSIVAGSFSVLGATR